VIALQEEALGFGALDPVMRARRLERSLADLRLPVGELLPLLGALHDLPLSPRFRAAELTPEARRRRTQDALVRWFLSLADEQPLTVVVEDLHWVDPTTLELVADLASRLTNHRVLLLVTHRPGFEPPASLARAPRMRLGRLEPAEATALAVSLRGEGAALTDDVVAQIVARSDGVPLFVEELAQAVRSAEGAPASARSRVPLTLQDSLMARLDQLGDGKELLQLGAVLGREFPLDVLARTSRLAGAELEVALESLVAAGLVVRREDGACAFRHALIQEQAYDALVRSTRQAHHRRVAEVLASDFAERISRHPELLAQHYDGAGAHGEASRAWLTAGKASLDRSASVEAERQLARGLASLSRVPESHERREAEILLLSLRGMALLATRGYGAREVEASFGRARELCQELGDSPHLFPVLYGLFLFYLVRAQGKEARELAAQLEATAGRSGSLDHALEAQGALGAVAFWEGRFAAAERHFGEVIRLFDPGQHDHHEAVYGQNPLAYAHVYTALSVFFLGRPEEALGHARTALEVAEPGKHPLTLAGVMSFTADLHHHVRDAEGFAALAHRLADLTREQHLAMWAGSTRSMVGFARVLGGEHAAGLAEMEAGLAEFRLTGAELNAAYLLSRLAEAHLAAGAVEAALARIDQALASPSTLDLYYEAELHRLRGEILLRGGRSRAEARDCLERALAVARRQGARALELRAESSLAGLITAEGVGIGDAHPER
jgi:predicted ATPase